MLPSIESDSIVLDDACGPAVVTQVIMGDFISKNKQTPKIHAIDFSQPMVDAVDEAIKGNNWTTVSAQNMNGQELKFDSDMFSHVISNLGIALFPDSQAGLREAYRTLAPGGSFGITSWHQVGYFEPLQKAYHAIRGDDVTDFKMPLEPGWFVPDTVRGYLEAVGFKDVQVKVHTELALTDDLETFVDHVMMLMIKGGAIGKELQEMQEDDYERMIEVFKKEMDKTMATDDQGRREMKMTAILTTGRK